MPTLPGCYSSAGLQQPPREGDICAQAVAALLDDMNTTLATSLLSAPLKAINDLMTTKSGKKQWDRCVLGFQGFGSNRRGGGLSTGESCCYG